MFNIIYTQVKGALFSKTEITTISTIANEVPCVYQYVHVYARNYLRDFCLIRVGDKYKKGNHGRY